MLRCALPALLLAPGAQAADPLCKDEYGTARCDPKQRARKEREFQVKPAESLAKQGWEGLRVFMSDGWSQSLPMLTVLKRPGGEAELKVSDGGKKTLQAAAGPELEAAVRTLLATEPEKSTSPAICADTWAGYLEALDKGQVTRHVLSGCQGGPLFNRAFALAPLAVDRLPPCKALRAEDYRNDYRRLETCLSLRGEDLQAAAEVLNRFTAIEHREPAALREALAADAVLTRPDGTSLKDTDAIVAWLTPKEPRTERSLDMLERTDLAAGPNAAKVEGALVAYDGKKSRWVDFTQHWVKGEDGTWRITRWVVKRTLTKELEDAAPPEE